MKLIVFLTLIFSFSVQAFNLKSFETDYCTFFPEGTPRSPNKWGECCVMHDLYYWVGGTKKDQNRADLTLRSCVKEKAGRAIAWTMYRGVRAGHLSPIKNKHSWSWGQDKSHPKFQKLSKLQVDEAIVTSELLEVEPEHILELIRDLATR